jgi:hypothetical protein
VPIHAVEEHGTHVFFVMGYVDGQTLRQRVEQLGPLGPRRAMKVFQDVAWALAYAHQRGVVHRDIKPDNIMLERGAERALVTDFGIAAVGREGAGAGEVIGTARYMSPEQACGEPVDARSDLYALGATMFYALTARPPLDAANVPAVLAKQVSEPAPGVRTVRADVPARLAAIVDQCLEKVPEQRPQTGDEIARIVGEAQGRDLRAPPVLRSFVRNAEITTMVFLATLLAGQGLTISEGGVTAVSFGPGLIGLILVIQLIAVARRLLREGYTFEDIRAALLAEARVQQEEAEAILQRRWLRRLDGLWHRLWAGRFGRWFFKVAGTGVKPPDRRALPSPEATELVLGQAAVDLFEELPEADRTRAGDAPAVIHRLEHRAERLREAGETGPALHDTVAALENVRLALLRLRAGAGSVQDLTLQLERARAIGQAIDRRLDAVREVQAVVKPG